MAVLKKPGGRRDLAGEVRAILAARSIEAETALDEKGLTVLHLYLPRDRARDALDTLRGGLPPGAAILRQAAPPQPESPAQGLLALERGDERVILYCLPPPEKHPAQKTKRAPKKPPPAPRERPVVALCIDDMGQSLEAVEWFERLDLPFNAAILPFLPRTEETARRLHAAGVEILCHLPMEPGDARAHPPGPGAILFGTGEPDLKAAVELALGAVPHARGFNNHMGSAMTADRLYMRWVFDAARGRAAYFLDSRTTPETVAEAVGAEAAFPVLRRHIFLDDVAEPAYVRRQLNEAVERARGQAHVIAIGHPHPATLRTLAEELPGLAGKARLVHLSDLIN